MTAETLVSSGSISYCIFARGWSFGSGPRLPQSAGCCQTRARFFSPSQMKRGTPEHPKVFRLAKLLNIPHYGAVGILELLWHFTARYAPQGDVGKHPDQFIAKALCWEKPTGRKGISPSFVLINALVEAKWLDSDPRVTCQWTPSDHQVTCQCTFNRLIVHHWCDHADEAVMKFLSRHSLDFVSTVSRLPLPLPLPLPEPEPEPENSGEKVVEDGNGKFDEFVVSLNSTDGVQKTKATSASRKKAYLARMKDPFFRDHWREAMAKVGQSDFCKGQNERGWKADIDWFLRPDTCARIMEGKYDNRVQAPKFKL